MPQQEVKLRPIPTSNIVLSWFTNLFRRGRQVLINLGTREVLPDINQQNAIEYGFNANAAVYSIIKADADKFASIPRYVYDAKSMEVKERLPKHLKAAAGAKRLTNNLSKLLTRPNPYQGQAAFFKYVRAQYKVEGEAFIWLNRGDNTDANGVVLSDMRQDQLEVLEMYPLPADHMTVVPDPDNIFGVAGYILKVGGQDLPIRKNDIIHWKDINLQFDASSRIHLRGMTPLKPGRSVLQQNNDATLASTRMYQNDGAKGILYGEETKGISPTQEGQIRGIVDRKVNNNDIKGAVASIFGAGKLGYLDLGGTSVDMQLLDGKKMSWQELCALFQVPYEIFDNQTTYANRAEAQKGWVSNSMIPASEELDDELNRKLLRAFKLEGLAVIASDPSKLPEMQANMKELAEYLGLSWWITPNEKREMMGYEKYGDATFDEPWVGNTVQPLSLATANDGFDALANEIGLSDYAIDPKKNGAKTQNQTA